MIFGQQLGCNLVYHFGCALRQLAGELWVGLLDQAVVGNSRVVPPLHITFKNRSWTEVQAVV